MITHYPSQSRTDSETLLVFQGKPNRAVQWSASAGTIIPIGLTTDRSGRAYARYIPPRPEGWERPYFEERTLEVKPIELVNPTGATGDMNGWETNTFEAIEREGLPVFHSNNDDATEDARQTIDLTPNASLIDGTGAVFELTWDMYARYYFEPDNGGMAIEYLDEAGNILGSFGPEFENTNSNWTERKYRGQIPAGSRSVRVRMVGELPARAPNNTYFRNLRPRIESGRLVQLTMTNPSNDAGDVAGWTQDIGNWRDNTSASNYRTPPRSFRPYYSNPAQLSQPLDLTPAADLIASGDAIVELKAYVVGGGDDAGTLGLRVNGEIDFGEIFPGESYYGSHGFHSAPIPKNTTAADFVYYAQGGYMDDASAAVFQPIEANGTQLVVTRGSAEIPQAPAQPITVEATYRA